MKKVIKFLFIVLWMILIFSFSNQNGTTSSNMSGGIIDNFISLLEKLGIVFPDEFIDTLGFVIRKFAHFALYFVLGFLLLSLLKEYSIPLKTQIMYAVMICLLYACSDEIHQLFVAGRDGKLLDVFIDTMGSLSSSLIVYIFRKRKEID